MISSISSFVRNLNMMISNHKNSSLKETISQVRINISSYKIVINYLIENRTE